MKLLDYIRGLRKGKEAHRLEKESMKDSFLADALEGYQQVEGKHEQTINQLQKQISARSSGKRNRYAIAWSIAACLILGLGISSYFLLLKKEVTGDVFIAKEMVESKTNPDSTTLVITIPKSDNSKIVASSRKSIKPNEKAKTKASAPIMESIADAEVKEVIVTNSETQDAAKEETINGTDVCYTGTGIDTTTNLKGELKLQKMTVKNKLTAQNIDYKRAEVPIVNSNRALFIDMQNEKKALSDNYVTGYSDSNKVKTTAAKATFVTTTPKRYIIFTPKEKTEQLRTPKPTVGDRKYKKYLKDKLVRPIDEECKNIKGEVSLTFFVDAYGNPQHITVIKSLCPSADKEAIRLIKDGPKWTIGNLPVTVEVEF